MYDEFGMLFEQIRCEPVGLMACIRLMEMLLRFVGCVVWRPRTGFEGIIVQTVISGLSNHERKRRPIVVYL